MTTARTAPILHARLDGRSAELPLAVLNLAPTATDAEIKEAVARRFDRPAAALAYHVVERATHAIIVRPEAVYG